jgi:hypothetical protein
MPSRRLVEVGAGSHEVRGKTLGIVGYGHIGTQVGVLAEALGMQVIFHDIETKLALGNAQPATAWTTCWHAGRGHPARAGNGVHEVDDRREQLAAMRPART